MASGCASGWSRRSRRAGTFALLALLAPLAWASAEPPPCHVEVALEPAQAFVGQQVLYLASVWMREDVETFEWSRAIAFPHVRSEVLPGDPRGDRRELADGVYRRHDERRALFAERSGSLRLSSPEGLCRSGGATRVVPVPEVVLAVSELPPGAPDGFSGLVGPVLVHQTVTPREVRLGESVRVALMLRSPGNLWALPPPYAQRLGSAELFLQRPELVLERGRHLLLRRHFVYDLVPREPGSLRVPELVIDYFDPEARRYARAQSPGVTIAVQPRATRSPVPQRAGPTDGAIAPNSSSAAGVAGLAVALGAVAVGLGVAWVIWRRRPGAASEVVAALREARETSSPYAAAPALERALRAALVRHVADARSVTPEALVARAGLSPAVRAAAQQLAAVERSRFDPQAPAPDPDAVSRAIAAL